MYQAAVRSLSRCCHKGACLSRATENDGSACNDGNRSVSVPEQVRRGGGPKVQMEESLSFGSNAFEMADGDGTGRRAMVYPTATMYRERGPEFGWCCAGKPRWDCLRAQAMEWNLNGSGEWKRGQSVEGQQGQGVTGEEGMMDECLVFSAGCLVGWTSCRCRNVSRRKSQGKSDLVVWSFPFPCWVRVVRDWQECPGTAVEKRG
ncbi:hypothetical protein GE21DRAFT_3048 [Neurospora crassa]|uniref:Uncharacterized protein n=1 Tax=Neurospora crassa (strain ATCC 24698 / 74-OR23-1A / CBS 708.71 / DSM 1257 / FGSC 987) TaxID=367110 RepID=Q7SC65_NEUCR|nr:hypothetical protein NCU06852 [Neurospora crassa OR74A]EAA34090.2 hypothetical protein NCU06852 [Neurospora crassa OR74A]KHE87573.1 hypothetical protein GE21DRAFT_3048 [Neurospora crassa]|eukprot:XP_963326.2 hypothetical protein NCU06852 [Neurospora crassa OR74A]